MRSGSRKTRLRWTAWRSRRASTSPITRPSSCGTERNILDETPQHCHTLKLQHPILTNRDLEKLRRVSTSDLLASTLPMLFRVDGGAKELERALDGLCRRASLAIKSRYSLLILS